MSDPILNIQSTPLNVNGQPVGDMTKAVYDPQGVNKISGGTTGAGVGGVLSMLGSDGGDAGNINTSAGSGDSTGGGYINTSGGASDGAVGGDITTYGSTLPGGRINTANGGGQINTGGTGLIQLGAPGTRTTFAGNASSDISIILPDLAGAVLLNTSPTGLASLLNAALIVPVADGTYTVGIGITTNGTITVSGGIITAIQEAT